MQSSAHCQLNLGCARLHYLDTSLILRLVRVRSSLMEAVMAMLTTLKLWRNALNSAIHMVGDSYNVVNL